MKFSKVDSDFRKLLLDKCIHLYSGVEIDWAIERHKRIELEQWKDRTDVWMGIIFVCVMVGVFIWRVL